MTGLGKLRGHGVQSEMEREAIAQRGAKICTWSLPCSCILLTIEFLKFQPKCTPKYPNISNPGLTVWAHHSFTP